MSEKKNIDKLFKEQLKDFEQAPNDIVWQRIEDELHKDKRKRRIIPIWWKVAGVAAVLALLFTVGKLVMNNSSENSVEQQIVDTENHEKNEASQESLESSKGLNKDNSKQLTNPSLENASDEDIDYTSIANQDDSSEKQQKEPQENHLTISNKKDDNNTIVSTNASDKEKQRKTSTFNKDKSQTKNAVAQTNSTNLNDTNKKQKGVNTNSKSASTVANTSDYLNEKDKDAKSIVKKEQSEIDKLIKDTKQSKETQVANSSTSEQKEALMAIDSSVTNEVLNEENAIENAIAEAEKKEETREEEEAIKRWSVAPNVAPVYFNTLGKGSSLDNQFVENSKDGDVNMSYGLKGSYAIGKKLKIRAGVNKVDLGYSTNNVLVFDSGNPTGARQIQNVQTNDTLSSTYISASSLSFTNAPELLFAQERGSIEQELGFIEVPIELEYNLLDKKIGLNLIGGFSTLFLNKNEIYSVENNGNRSLLGEATNIKDMSYSANFGVGVNYNISKQLRFNLEPTFKYQINTFSNTSGDFQPFFVGVYTGLSFKF